MSSQALLSRTLQDLVRAGARLGGDVVEHIITLRDERLGLVVSPDTYGMRTKSRIDLPTRRLELDLAAISTPISVQRCARCVDNGFEPEHEIIDSPLKARRSTIVERSI